MYNIHTSNNNWEQQLHLKLHLITSLGTTAEKTPTVSSTGVALETSTPVMTSSGGSTSLETTPALISAIESLLYYIPNIESTVQQEF